MKKIRDFRQWLYWNGTALGSFLLMLSFVGLVFFVVLQRNSILISSVSALVYAVITFTNVYKANRSWNGLIRYAGMGASTIIGSFLLILINEYTFQFRNAVLIGIMLILFMAITAKMPKWEDE